MGSTLIATGKTSKNVDYRIYNIDNTYTLYIQIGSQPNTENPTVSKPIYSAIRSFSNFAEAKEYVAKL